MTTAEVYTMLNSITGFNGKVAYETFSESAPALPFICFYATDTDNFKADNKVYFKRQNIIIELYTEKKDPTVEGTVETALDAAELTWEKSESYINEERCFLIAYEVEV